MLNETIVGTKSNNIDEKVYTELKIENENLKNKNSILNKELQESKGMNWILSQVIKACGTIDSFENLMNNITDILMGILGLDTCTVWMKKGNEYVSYSRSVYHNNKYEVKENEKLPEFLLKIKETSSFDVSSRSLEFCKGENVKSMLIAPLEDFRIASRMGVIIAEHKKENFFAKNTVDFFNILSTQVSIAAINSKLFEKINEMTNKDILTSCYNRNYFEKLMLNMNANHEKYTLTIFDLDNFKKVNDLLGHKKGDEILVEIGNLAIDTFKKYKGEVIRYGGDEFVIILFKSLHESIEILEDFKESVPQLQVIKETGINVTITIGIASYVETVSDMKDIFNAADLALIRGKNNGEKNKIHIGYK